MIRRATFFIFILTLLCTGISMADIARDGKDRAIKASLLKLPLSFVENEGQKDKSILFYEQGNGHATAFTREGVSLALARSGKIKAQSPEVITLMPLHAVPFTVTALDKQEGKVNYFVGKDPKYWKTDIPTYGAILYQGIYSGIDMKFYGSNSQLEYDIIIAPHADPAKVRLSYKGIEKLSLTPQGELEITLKSGSVFQKKPFVYQAANGKKMQVQGKFVLLDNTTYGFEVGSYDKSRPLVIDPTLVYSTYLGGYGADRANAIAVDSSGNAYVAGQTLGNFPTTNPYQGSFGGAYDAFITKLSSSGGALVYSTYLGGASADCANAIAVDSSGNAYVAGVTGSSDFPTINAYQSILNGAQNAFVAKLSSSGKALTYSTYLGGASYDYATGIAVDSSGNAYITGNTQSSDFPTKNAYQGALIGNLNAFVAKLSSSGKTLTYSTYLGRLDDTAVAIAVDSSGNAYVTGSTNSYDFPTKNAYQATMAGDSDIFITKLGSSGDSLVYSTYLGGRYTDQAAGIAVNSSGNVYVTGYTWSTDFPVVNAYQGALTGSQNTVVAKLGSTGSTLVYSTYLGGTSWDFATGIAVDSSGNAWVAGYTTSTDFPTKNAYQGALGGTDAFVAELNPSSSGSGSLVYSTYLAGTGGDEANAIAVDSSGNAYVTGWTSSKDFPTVNPYQEANHGTNNVFIAKLGSSSSTGKLTLTVSKTGAGSGTVTATGLTCSGGACSGIYSKNAKVKITGTPGTDTAAPEWTGCDSSSGTTCTIAMTADKSVTVEFEAVSCACTLSSSSKSFTYKNGSVNVTVTGTGAKTCSSPSVTASDAWLGATIASFKNNKGVVKITVPALAAVSGRAGTVTIGGKPFAVTQTGTPCTLSISRTKDTLTSSAQSAYFSVIAPTGCEWTAGVSSGATSWLNISSGASGTVTYAVTQNTTSKQRNGKITVYLNATPTKTKVFSVTQKK